MTMGAHFTFTLASGSIMFYICRLFDITLVSPGFQGVNSKCIYSEHIYFVVYLKPIKVQQIAALRNADLVDGEVDTGPFNQFLDLMEGCRPDFPAFR